MRPLAEPPALNPQIKYVEKADRHEIHTDRCINIDEPDRDTESSRLAPDDPRRRVYLLDSRM